MSPLTMVWPEEVDVLIRVLDFAEWAAHAEDERMIPEVRALEPLRQRLREILVSAQQHPPESRAP